MSVVIDGSNGLTFPDTSTQANSVSVSGLGGTSQTWQNLTGSRSLSTTYTNSTGKPIAVIWTSTAGNNPSITVAGTTIVSGVAYLVSTFFIVPIGATYSIAATGAGYNWFELR